MRTVIRADASPEIGSGHIARCLSLADALKARGAEVCFVSRAMPGHMAQAISASGHSLVTLSIDAPHGMRAPQEPWPENHQAEDARATCAALGSARPDWLIADHYGLDHVWERAMRPAVSRLMAIDDLARAHDCDLLLDTNLHSDARARYTHRVGHKTALLLGPVYALLRPEFAKARASIVPRTGPVRRVLVFMGGMDSLNATQSVLETLALLHGPQPQVDVVIGASHPARAEIEAHCLTHLSWRLHVQTPDMAQLLAQCDLAIGAGGGATWERCCLGVPTLAIALAENQRALLSGAARAGVVYWPDGGLPPPKQLAMHLTALLDNTALRESMSLSGMALLDGRGTQRVASALLGVQITVRPAVQQDCEDVHAWRNARAVREASRNSSDISLADHRAWFDAVLHSPDRPLLIGSDTDGPAGVVRFDIEGTEAEVSIYVVPARLGQGLGCGLLSAAEAWLAANRPEVSAIHALALAGNEPSRHLFEQSGYQLAARRFSKKMQA